jgi:hypothetical protein
LAALSLAFFQMWGKPCLAHSQAQADPRQADESAIALPPMGWSSWNSFSNTVDSKVIVQQTLALVSSGMKKAGYTYVNIDEGWWMGKRDPQGNIVVDPKQWPALQPGEHAGDMSNIVRYIHGAGLKAGIYTDAGEAGCSFYGPDLGPPVPHTGSEGHYDQDFLQFARWGFDYVKVDWCGGNHEKLDPAAQYAEIAHAIARAEKRTGHRLYYSICNWGSNQPWTWAPGIGGVRADIWRTSGDIVAPIVAGTPNATRRASFTGVLSNFDQGIHNEAQHTGYYNDPDMMMIGMAGLSEAQNRVHMSLWAISGAPLIVGADLSKLDGESKEILTNRDVLSVDQDPLGIQAIKVEESHPGLQVWAKPLSTAGGRAVLLLNRTPSTATIEVTWKQIGLEPHSSANVQDLWTGKELGPIASSYAAEVQAGDAAFFRVHGSEVTATRYDAPSSASRKVTTGVKESLSFVVAPISGVALVHIAYQNRSGQPRIAQLRVDGQTPTNILFPPTGKAQRIGSVTCEVKSDHSGPSSILAFSSLNSVIPILKSISVQPFGEP